MPGLKYNDCLPKANFLLAFFLTVSCLSVSSQSSDIYKQLIKESIDKDIIFQLTLPEPKYSPHSEPVVIELDVKKKPLPVLGYNYKQNSLYLHYKEPPPVRNEYTVSPYALGYGFRNEAFNPSSTETTGDIIANGILTPLAAVGTFNIIVLADYLMRIGVLPDEPFVSKEKKKDKALREIKALYGIE